MGWPQVNPRDKLNMKSSDCASFNSCMEATLAAIFRGIPMAQVHKMFVEGTQGDSAGIPDMLASVARVMAGYQNNSTYLEEDNGMVVNLIKLKSGASTAKGTQNLMSRLLTNFQPKTFRIGPLVTERMMHGLFWTRILSCGRILSRTGTKLPLLAR